MTSDQKPNPSGNKPIKEEDPRVEIARKNMNMAIALRGTTKADVARKIGMSRNGISQFTAGRSVLSYENMLKACDILGIPISVMHQPDAITENRIRLHRALLQLPDHLASDALDILKQKIQRKS